MPLWAIVQASNLCVLFPHTPKLISDRAASSTTEIFHPWRTPITPLSSVDTSAHTYMAFNSNKTSFILRAAIRRFSHHRQFLKYCGFDLSKQQSGKHIGSEVLSKRGNALLRRTFWMAACSAVRQPENSFHEKYKRYTTKDPKNKDLIRKALTAVAAKIARVAYSLVKNNSQYRPCHELRLPSGMTSLCVNHRGNI